jgi:hypothetical protein
MRLSCNLITSNPSRFWTAGEPIPDELVPDHARQYRISEKEGEKLYREVLEWRAIVAERKAKKREEAERRHGAARASKG